MGKSTTDGSIGMIGGLPKQVGEAIAEQVLLLLAVMAGSIVLIALVAASLLLLAPRLRPARAKPVRAAGVILLVGAAGASIAFAILLATL